MAEMGLFLFKELKMESPNPRAQMLVNVLHHGLAKQVKKTTRKTLGDRSTYIGLSDIAQFTECPRMAVLNKINPNISATSFSKLMTMQRGHWFENGVAEMLTASNISYIPQLEIYKEENGVLVKAHLDFTLIWPNVQAVRILEVKSMNSIPDVPYTSHITQIQSQVSMLKKLWSSPAFSLRSPKGRIIAHDLTFPELCRNQLGFLLPETCDNIELEGWILCIGMTDAKGFGPYLPDEIVYDNTILQASQMFQAIHGDLNNLTYTHGYCIDCNFCEYANSCQKYKGEIHTEFEDSLTRLKDIKKEKHNLQQEAEKIESYLKTAYININTSDWIISGQNKFKVSTSKGRESIDIEKLKNNLREYMSVDEAQKLIDNSMKTGNPISRLNVK